MEGARRWFRSRSVTTSGSKRRSIGCNRPPSRPRSASVQVCACIASPGSTNGRSASMVPISVRDYVRLKAALDRLQSTTIATSIRQRAGLRLHRFSWINEWKERVDGSGGPLGIELILPDWFYAGVIDETLVLNIDRAYFHLTGGIERWLYRLVRKHGGWQRGGWRFDFRHLHSKSGSLARFSDFAIDLRNIASRQSLPGYRLSVILASEGAEVLAFQPTSSDAINAASGRAAENR